MYDPGATFVFYSSDDRHAKYLMENGVVLPGVELGFYGAGVEYFPIKSARKSVRFHAFWCSNTSESAEQTFNIGLRWQMDLLKR
mgnify:CR=1 FL=1